MKSTASLGTPTAAVYTVKSVDKDATGNTVVNLDLTSITGGTALTYSNLKLVENQGAVTAGVAIQPYGSITIPSTATGTDSINLDAYDGVNTFRYARTVTQLRGLTAGGTLTLSKV